MYMKVTRLHLIVFTIQRSLMNPHAVGKLRLEQIILLRTDI